MLLYLDDDMIHRILVKLLQKAGHDVQLPEDVGRSGNDDAAHLTHAISNDRVFLSFNHDDFEQLHELIKAAKGHHPGILMVRRDGDKRDLKPHKIASALANLIALGDPIPNNFTILNQYR